MATCRLHRINPKNRSLEKCEQWPEMTKDIFVYIYVHTIQYVRLGYSEKYISSKKKIEYIDENEFKLMQAGWIKYIRYLNCLLRVVERKKMKLFEKKTSKQLPCINFRIRGQKPSQLREENLRLIIFSIVSQDKKQKKNRPQGDIKSHPTAGKKKTLKPYGSITEDKA